MENFFKQLLSQVVTYFVFLVLMLFTFACLMTGEFPPRKESVKAQYQALLEVKNNAVPLLKLTAEKLRVRKSTDVSAAALAQNSSSYNVEELKSLMKQGLNTENLEEVRQDQALLKKKLDTIIQQNNEILNLLNKK